MKLRAILNIAMILTNLASLFVILGLLFDYQPADYFRTAEPTACIPFRFQAYMQYVTCLFNLYFIFYLLIRKKFKVR
jgi:hypothetical protein